MWYVIARIYKKKEGTQKYIIIGEFKEIQYARLLKTAYEDKYKTTAYIIDEYERSLSNFGY